MKRGFAVDRPFSVDWSLAQKLDWLQEITELAQSLRPIPAPIAQPRDGRSCSSADGSAPASG